jgi:hypothetical protein
MDNVRYIGLDVHGDTISAAVLDGEGKLVMEAVLPTRAAGGWPTLSVPEQKPGLPHPCLARRILP